MEVEAVSLLQMVAGKFPVLGVVLMGLGCLIVAAQAYVFITPSKEDDAWWNKVRALPVIGDVLKAFEALSVIKKK